MSFFRRRRTISEQANFAPIADSACVENTRRQFWLTTEPDRDIPLRAVAFGGRTLAGEKGWWGLQDLVDGKIAGEVCFWRMPSKTDPVDAYLCVRLCSGVCLESVEFASSPRIAHLFAQGIPLGQLVEEELPREPTWWRRFFHGKRAWQVFLHDSLVGRIEFEYPLTKKSRLHLQLISGRSLPIRLASLWFNKPTRFVIPPDTPAVSDEDLETLHFLLNVHFRALIQLDFVSGP